MKGIWYSWNEKLIIVKVNAIPIRSPMDFLEDTQILELTQNSKGSRVAVTILKRTTFKDSQ
jgi:hypothetical protein